MADKANGKRKKGGAIEKLSNEATADVKGGFSSIGIQKEIGLPNLKLGRKDKDITPIGGIDPFARKLGGATAAERCSGTDDSGAMGCPG